MQENEKIYECICGSWRGLYVTMERTVSPKGNDRYYIISGCPACHRTLIVEVVSKIWTTFQRSCRESS